MFLVACAGFLAVVQHAVCSTQNPPVTQCPGLQGPSFEIQKVKISDAKLGQEIKFDAVIVVNQATGVSPVLHISFARPDGTELPCIQSVFPCELKTCDGTTEIEKVLNADWGNKCPVPPGTYKAHLAFTLPDSQAARLYLGDGNLITTVSVVDNGQVLGCASFPLVIDVQ